MTDPRVSIIIPTHNGASTIGLQLEALRRQEDAPSFEVIVVDNNSTDHLQDVLQDLVDNGTYALRLVRAADHKGSSYARNVGLGFARAEFVQFCDDDDVVSRFWVRNGLAASKTVPIWSGSALPKTPDLFTSTLDRVWKDLGCIDAVASIPGASQPGKFPVLMGGNFGGRRTTLDSLRGFDQRFAHHGDDNDLAARSVAAGFGVPLAPAVSIAYRGRYGTRDLLRRGFYASRAKRLLRTVHGPDPASPTRPWPIAALRLLIATLLNPVRQRLSALDLLLRWSYLLGDISGYLRFVCPGSPPPPQIGLGIGEGTEVPLAPPEAL
ncbi:glycosyltransferase family 2 protein [Brachybacterium sp. Marseille-Q7125]|uniref:glycosyltransferase family 2 protein n=1 Tax=Brachybacterium sp. Marseille-Q7125 TaxID=2932815 RepID=UPI001FF44F6C|nr:glycosyltransferase family 2 protein [Brachybacterium sp. Marseille-Q7125]